MAEPRIGVEKVKTATSELVDLLKIRTIPFGLKLFEDFEEMRAIPGLRTPSDGKFFTTCQLVTQVRTAGFTLGIVRDNLRPGSSCGANIGLEPVPEELGSGEKMTGVWFGNQDAAKAHQDQMPRVEAGRYSGLAASPLRSGRLDSHSYKQPYSVPIPPSRAYFHYDSNQSTPPLRPHSIVNKP